MAITITSTNPQGLLNEIYRLIDAEEILRWEYDLQGDFTLTIGHWRELAWLRPAVEAQQLQLSIICPKGKYITDEIFGVYHGSFIELLYTKFKGRFSNISLNSLRPEIVVDSKPSTS